MRDRKGPIAALALPLALLAAACAGGDDSNGAAPKNDAGSPEGRIIRADPPANEAMPEEPDPGPAGMTPYHRRVYDRGFRDCRAGRYDPDPYPESYRIGCAAAQDSGDGALPQG